MFIRRICCLAFQIRRENPRDTPGLRRAEGKAETLLAIKYFNSIVLLTTLLTFACGTSYAAVAAYARDPFRARFAVTRKRRTIVRHVVPRCLILGMSRCCRELADFIVHRGDRYARTLYGAYGGNSEETILTYFVPAFAVANIRP